MKPAPASPVKKKIKIDKQTKNIYIDTGYPLPEKYNEDIIVVLPRDPYWIFVYWEINDDTIKRITNGYSAAALKQSEIVLRLHAVAGVKVQGSNSPRHTDFPVSLSCQNWYLKVSKPGRAYWVELGIKTLSGNFISLARSNRVELPSGDVSTEDSSEWMSVSEKYGELLSLSGVDKIGASSFEIARILAHRWKLIGGSSSGGSKGIPEKGISVSRNSGAFRLQADADVVIRGSTEPTAKLFVNGKRILIGSAGVFRIGTNFPDGKQEFVIKAVSDKGDEERKIIITVERKTK
ncbi:MAG: hypothetical protein BWY26_00870 [Elusimicrobia bacterium ADurb.Bin231]|nr:MAG: hypothetical protein BWY26_00870 [Elusimicrobia bacterium ADurb.Bin231]